MALSQIIKSLCMIALMVIPGFIFGKIKLIDDHHLNGISTIIVNMCVPAIIIDAFQIEYTNRLMMSIILTAGFWVVTLIFAALIGIFIKKILHLSKKELAVVLCALMVPNTAYIGIPLFNALYGSETLFYSSVCEIINDLFVYTLVFGFTGMMTGLKRKFNIKDIINPPIISVIIGFVLFKFNIILPDFIGSAVKSISNATAPLAMFVVGAQLSQISLKEFIGDKRVYFVCFSRLIIMPLLTFFMIRGLIHERTIFSIVFILAQGLPSGAICSVVAQNYNGDVSLATKCIMISNILCLLTIPVFAMLV